MNVEVYHHTSPAKLKEILATGVLRSAGEPHVYVTTEKRPITGYGSAVVRLIVPESVLELDDEFPDGRIDYRIDVGRPGGVLRFKPVK